MLHYYTNDQLAGAGDHRSEERERKIHKVCVYVSQEDLTKQARRLIDRHEEEEIRRNEGSDVDEKEEEAEMLNRIVMECSQKGGKGRGTGG